mmetsp:Transcript_10649/g.35323  ORF Transcript_10649/g.35323 Transcript_10649/m.35323 type:complete len:282 (+) Transcript_10649:210-1055(+)
MSVLVTMPSRVRSSATTGRRPMPWRTRMASSSATVASGPTVATFDRIHPFTLASASPLFSALTASLSFSTPRSRLSPSTTTSDLRSCSSKRSFASAIVAVSLLSVTTYFVIKSFACSSAGICPMTASNAARITSEAPAYAPAVPLPRESDAAAADLWPPPPKARMTARRSTVTARGRARPMTSIHDPLCSAAMMSTSAAVRASSSSATIARPGTKSGVRTATVAILMPRNSVVVMPASASARQSRWPGLTRSTPNSATAACDAPQPRSQQSASASRVVVDS